MLSRKDQLTAIAWKSNQIGMTYGKYVSVSSESELQKAYREYEAMLREKEKRFISKQKTNISYTNERVGKEDFL